MDQKPFLVRNIDQSILTDSTRSIEFNKGSEMAKKIVSKLQSQMPSGILLSYISQDILGRIEYFLTIKMN